MKVKEMYGSTTEKGINATMSNLSNLDPNLTVGEILSVLGKLRKKAKQRELTRKRNLINKTVGKCISIDFEGRNQYRCILKIDSIDLREQYGSVDAVLFGTKIEVYEGKVEILKMEGKEEYGQFFPNKTLKDFDPEIFNQIVEQVETTKKLALG